MDKVYVVLIIVTLFIIGCTPSTPGQPEAGGSIKTFKIAEGNVCTEDGKPVIRLFSTTWCPHCTWIKETFDSTVQDYVGQGKIVAYHWEMDTGDNTLTSQVEKAVPDAEQAIARQVNPEGYVPGYVFGCKYYRIGNGYESQQDLAAEEAEFRAVIETLIQESQ